MTENMPKARGGRHSILVMVAAVALFDGYDVFVPTDVIHYLKEQ